MTRSTRDRIVSAYTAREYMRRALKWQKLKMEKKKIWMEKYGWKVYLASFLKFFCG